ncbi:heparinase II/III family protein [Pontibacter sp. SGAir0037]|uniref:heparinase II/III domain-containing protein n=1 Tax=Pontibacter sp. SGAir0037 TaxID=2571030 RepID=UPI0010CCDEA9|nr:heparinase II/III family protein [Pontibacter sp. SGAir0037]QCR20984.1 heparinase [Pontibacter sp. SGAir0037]
MDFNHVQVKRSLLILFFSFSCLISNGQVPHLIDKRILPAHPRLFLTGDALSIDKFKEDEAVLKRISSLIIADCEQIILQKPIERNLIGKRLLDKSREGLRRIFYLSYAWRLTKDKRFLKRAETELLSISEFDDWNPHHFLDVSEMTLAVAIGYDWLYDELSFKSKKLIEKAIYEKGLKPSLDNRYNSWLRMTSNWNQVCNAGIVIGALSVYETYPGIANHVINQAISSIKLPMDAYGPDGGYPEGYNYWGYGTTFNVMLIDVLLQNFNNDFKLLTIPGFLNTAYFMLHMVGPSGIPFNFGDSDQNVYLQPAMLWFSKYLKDGSLVRQELDFLTHCNDNTLVKERLLPLVILWGERLNNNERAIPKSKFWIGSGATPVALMRSSWSDKNAIFVGIKGGGNKAGHGHLDMGSFVLDANGERWAMDLGMQNYESLESKGVDLWSMHATSQRWKVFRFNNFSHNTLSVNNTLQNSEGFAPFINYSDVKHFKNAQIDLKQIYNAKFEIAKRGIGIVNNEFVLLKDEIKTSLTDITVRWSFITDAEILKVKKNSVWLKKNNQMLLVTVVSPKHADIRTWSTIPKDDIDEPNPGTNIIGFETFINQSELTNLTVTFKPIKMQEKPRSSRRDSKIFSLPLSKWPTTKR